MKIGPEERDGENRRRDEKQPVNLPLAQMFAGIHWLSYSCPGWML